MNKNFQVLCILAIFLILAVVSFNGPLENTYPNGEPPRGIRNFNFLVNSLGWIAGPRTFSYVMMLFSAPFLLALLPKSKGQSKTKAFIVKKPKTEKKKKSKTKLSKTERAFVGNMMKGLVDQLEHGSNLEVLRQKQPFYVKLVPQVPVERQTSSWFGGLPYMPESIDWPVGSDNLPMYFIAQIDLSQIPDKLWEGLGPRKGWLLIFSNYETGTAKVIHSPVMGPVRTMPPIPPSRMTKYGHWFYSGPDKYDDIPSAIRSHPHWPVNIVPMRAGANSETWHHGNARSTDENPSPTTQLFTSSYDIREPRLLPFDWHSLWCLIRATRYPVKYGKRAQESQISHSEKQIQRNASEGSQGLHVETNYERKKIETARQNLKCISQTESSITTLENTLIEAKREGKTFTNEIRDQYLSQITQLHMPGCNIRNKDNPSYLSYVSAPKSGSWHSTYVGLLLDYAKHLYISSPQSLPIALWQELYQHLHFDSATEFGLSGHYPTKYVHDFNDKAEVTLLQLPSSNLLKWMWGDVNDLVLTIAKSDLRRNDFSSVKMQITN